MTEVGLQDVWSSTLSVCWFLVNSGSLGIVFACYQAVLTLITNFTVLLDLLGKKNASIPFVPVFVEFVDFAFVYSSGCMVNVTKAARKCFNVARATEIGEPIAVLYHCLYCFPM